MRVKLPPDVASSSFFFLNKHSCVHVCIGNTELIVGEKSGPKKTLAGNNGDKNLGINEFPSHLSFLFQTH